MNARELKVHRNRIENFVDVATRAALVGREDEAIDLLKHAAGELEMMIAKIEGSWPFGSREHVVITESGQFRELDQSGDD